jgi:hypothetical protein
MNDIRLIIFILSTSFYLTWLYKTYEIAAKINPKTATYKPAYVVSSYFIPFFSLFQPYKNLREILISLSLQTKYLSIVWIIFNLSNYLYLITPKINQDIIPPMAILFTMYKSETIRSVSDVFYNSLYMSVLATFSNVLFFILIRCIGSNTLSKFN